MSTVKDFPRSLRLKASDGLSLHLMEWSSEGTPMLLIHGFGNDCHVWDEFAPQMAPYYRTIAIDLRGHGDSDRDPSQRYDYPFHVRDLDKLTKSLSIDRVVLVAHSFGGRAAMLFGATYPEKMAGLVLVDTGPEFDQRGTGRIRNDTEKRRGQTFTSKEAYAELIGRNYPNASPTSRRRLVEYGLTLRSDGLFEQKTDPKFHLSRQNMTVELQEEHSKKTTKEMWTALGRIPCPTLVVRGAASDVMSPEIADKMVDTLPHGKLAVVAQASHSVMLDNADGFSKALQQFVLGED